MKIIYGTYVATPDSMCKQPSHAYSFHFIVIHTNYLCIPGCCDSFSAPVISQIVSIGRVG